MNVSPERIDALTELINIGVGRAASSLNQMCGAHVRLQVPSVAVVDGDDLDTVIGLVLRQQLLIAEREGKGEVALTEMVAPINRVSEELPVMRLLDLFIKRREHMFLVEDEYGQTEGIVTLEDAVETLLGREIMDESDTVEDMQELARSKYRGRLRDAR